jgi:hypothetical protein
VTEPEFEIGDHVHCAENGMSGVVAHVAPTAIVVRWTEPRPAMGSASPHQLVVTARTAS